MADTAVRFEFPKQEVDALFRQINRATKELGLSLPHALNSGMKAVLTSMAKQTRVADRYRGFRKVGVSRSGKTNKYEVDVKYMDEKRKTALTVRDGDRSADATRGPRRGVVVYATGVQALRRRPIVKIAMSGLAAESWKQAGKKGRLKITKAEAGGSRDAANKRRVKRAARSWVTYKMHKDLSDPYVMVRNRLPYIEDALEGGGAAAQTAMENAAKGLEKSISKQLQRRIKK